MVSVTDPLFWVACLAIVASGVGVFLSNRASQGQQVDKRPLRQGVFMVALGATVGGLGLLMFSGLNTGMTADEAVFAPPYWVTYVLLALSLIAIVSGLLLILNLKNRAKYFFLLPATLWILGFTLFPLLYSLYLSFTNAALGRPTSLIGLDNYINIFKDNNVGQAVSVNAFMTIGGLVLTLVFGTFVAWLFNHDIPGLRALRAILTMPLFAAPVALGWLGIMIFNETSGPVNNIIRALGGAGVEWIISPAGAQMAVMIIDVWQWTPFVFIVALAAMQGVPEELVEAARLDTNSGWTIFWRITFPLISPALGTVALLRLVETFKILDIPISLTQGGPGAATKTYSFLARQIGLQSPFRQGYASAMAYLVVILCIVISTIYFSRVRERFD